MNFQPAALDRFWYWCRERHNIYRKKQKGLKPPWTTDPILQNWFFTNPYRENDKVTVWFRENIRDPLKNNPKVLFATVCFRWFNRPDTGRLLWGGDPRLTQEEDVSFRLRYQGNLLIKWDKKQALNCLDVYRSDGGKLFTGAFIINSPPGIGKLESICERIDNVWRDRNRLLRSIVPGTSLEAAHNRLMSYPGLGGFMAYEIVCDLRYTYLLRDAIDKNTWCNPGPGCIRGLHRLTGEKKTSRNNSCFPPKPKDWLEGMKELLRLSHYRLQDMPRFEMREVEHSLCEFDKYERAMFGDGKMKRTYPGGK